MGIESIRPPLEECANHYEKFEQIYTGSVTENIGAGNVHLHAAAAAIKLAIEKVELANAFYAKAEVSARQASGEARVAERIANSGIGRGSADLFISNLLPSQSRALSDFSQSVPSALVQTQGKLDGRSGSIRTDLRKALRVVEGSVESLETQNQLVQENGQSSGQWAGRIRSYLRRM